MEKINNLDQYNTIRKQLKESGCKLSNCFWLTNYVEQLIQTKPLFYYPIDKGGLFLESEKEFYRCFYFLHPESDYNVISLDKDAVIEFPYRNVIAEKENRHIQRINQLGFTLGRESSQMILDIEQLSIENLQSTYKYHLIPEDYCEEVYDLYSHTFNPLYAFIPEVEEIRNLMNQGLFYGVFDEDKLIGVVDYLANGNECVFNHMLIREEYRGMKIGRELMQKAILHCVEVYQPKRIVLWVDIQNVRAVHLYESIGFQMSMKKANEYIRQQ